MASKEMARRFIGEADVYNEYSNIIDYTLTVFIAKAEKEGNARFAADLRNLKATYHPDFQKAIEITEQVYADAFTDDELNDLILLHNNSALKKARAHAAKLLNTILERVMAVSP
ncbi:MAG: hypothetical protein U0587_09570 [Candidatus Binatia bacterium]